MEFAKYHALGNDYIVIEPDEAPDGLSEACIRRICHRNYGVGSDGILWGPIDVEGADFGVRIYNPDGSEAEKSGNGLRIFARYLWDRGLAQKKKFTVLTEGGWVRIRVHGEGEEVTVDMGRVSFNSREIPVAGPDREVLNEPIKVDGQRIEFSAATVGNPHCVILADEVNEELARTFGPPLETAPRFPNKTNVQFMKVLDRNNIMIEIWERGAGYTLASGSSASACAAVAKRLGLCDKNVQVHMPGGVISIAIGEDFSITMTGSVTRVADGIIYDEALGDTLRAVFHEEGTNVQEPD